MSPDVDRRLVRCHFDRHAEEYDRYARIQKEVVRRLIAFADWQSAPAGPVLDLGCGTGYLGGELARGGRAADLVVGDLAHAMTCCARRRTGARSGVDLDATRLPFVDGAFALVASSSVYQWVEPLEAAFAELARVLCPGGSFLLALFGADSLRELRRSHRMASARFDAVSHVQDFPSVGDVRAALVQAGLACRRIESEILQEYHPDVPALLRSLKKIGAGNASSKRPPGLASRRVMQAMIDLYEESWRDERGIPASYEVIYLFGSKR
ncbi:MAG: methyltransferase domain-containing protein [Deltaproteobacteria bacterium]|nr:MAG: methyltransferase domain-containing protein [Deltaproteobacteria bacterium]